MLEDRSIRVLAYNLTTILAEKLEAVVSRGDQNTRPRDYYDIYILTKLQLENIDLETLAYALQATAKQRGSLAAMGQYLDIMGIVRGSEIMNHIWNKYRKDFDYATNIKFTDVCDAVIRVIASLPEL